MSDVENSAKKQQREFLLLFITYSFVIAGVLWWSSRVAGPSVYDRYIARLEGVTVAVSDESRARKFFGEVLDFPALAGQSGVSLPDGHKLLFKVTTTPAPSEVYLDIRNGLGRLHDIMQQRCADVSGVSVSDVTTKDADQRFEITDFDGNRFVFQKLRNRFLKKVRG